MTERNPHVTCGMYADSARNLETSLAAGRVFFDNYWNLKHKSYDPEKIRDRIFNERDLSFECLSGAEIVISGRLFIGEGKMEGAIFSYIPNEKIDKKLVERIAEQNGYNYNPSSNSYVNTIFAFFERRNGSFNSNEIRMFAATVDFLEDEASRVWNLIWEFIADLRK